MFPELLNKYKLQNPDVPDQNVPLFLTERGTPIAEFKPVLENIFVKMKLPKNKYFTTSTLRKAVSVWGSSHSSDKIRSIIARHQVHSDNVHHKHYNPTQAQNALKIVQENVERQKIPLKHAREEEKHLDEQLIQEFKLDEERRIQELRKKKVETMKQRPLGGRTSLLYEEKLVMFPTLSRYLSPGATLTKTQLQYAKLDASFEETFGKVSERIGSEQAALESLRASYRALGKSRDTQDHFNLN
jgi:hypothetical protein